MGRNKTNEIWAVAGGKGGTGKTTIAMAIAKLNENTNMSDCDVDASNLYLYFDGNDVKKEYFYAGKVARINRRFCTECGICEPICKFDAISDFTIDPNKCEGCGACMLVCPEDAITLKDKKAADAYITKVNDGVLTRAQMEIGSDGSGKLVSLLREQARNLSEKNTLIVIDGSPGIGCPVIASITASDIALIVTEPSMSGLSDFKRISELCSHFAIPTLVCINKYDINEDIVAQAENHCAQNGIRIVGKIPFDDTVMQSINELRPITDYTNSKANIAVRAMWKRIKVYTDQIIYNQQREDERI